MKIKFTNYFNNRDLSKQEAKVLDVKGKCVITNYDPRTETPSSAGDITVTVDENSATVQKGKSVFNYNAEQVDFNQKKYSVFTELAKMDGDSNDLSLEDLRKAKEKSDKGETKGFKVKFDPDAGVASIIIDGNELLRIDFETDKEKKALDARKEDDENTTDKNQLDQLFTTYEVSDEDTLYSISEKTGRSIKEIMDFNEMSDSTLKKGMILKIPTMPTTEKSQKLEIKHDETNNRKYIVIQQGDTLYNIAKRLGISQELLLKYNPLITDSSKINVMDELWIEPQLEELEQDNGFVSFEQIDNVEQEKVENYNKIIKTGTRKLVNDWKNVFQISGQHIIKKGEMLSEIALKYDIPLEVLKNDNNIKNADKIKEGAILKINYYVYEIQEYGNSTQIARQVHTNQELRNDLKLEIEVLNNITEEYSYKKGDLVRLPNNITIQSNKEKMQKIDKEIKNTDKKDQPRDFEKNFEGYKKALALQESSNTENKVNRYGYIGLYQFGEMQLVDIGIYYEKDKGYGKNDWNGIFRKNKYGITSKSDFLSSREKQDAVLVDSMNKNWQYIIHFGLDKNIGKTYKGIKITKSGLLAGAHLVGIGGLKDFFEQGIDTKDGNGVSVSEYIKKFGDYNVDNVVG